MIRIQKDDTIVDIVDRIEASNDPEIVLDFPVGHPILHNYIALKILKSKAWEKQLVIATADRVWKKIGKKLGISYSLIKDHDFIKRKTEENILQHNYTFWEYLKYQSKQYIKEFRQVLETNKQINTLWKYSQSYKDSTPLKIFLLFFLLSLVIFFFVYYFAVSKTSITIRPEILVRKEAKNFLFEENYVPQVLSNSAKINVDKISQNIKLSEKYTATGLQNNNKLKSRGKIKIINTSDEEVSFIPETRFASPEWYIYQTETWVQIPPAIRDNFWNMTPGTLEASVIAQGRDESGKILWSRGNIASGVRLTIPGLDAQTQKEIYAETLEDFTWGMDQVDTLVTQEDLDTSRELFEKKLRSDAFNYLKQNILSENQKNNTHFNLITAGDSLQYSESSIQLENGIEVWTPTPEFSYSGSITITGYIYDSDIVINEFKTLVNERVINGVEKVSSIDNDSLHLAEVLSLGKDPFTMKATFQIDALFIKDFSDEDNSYLNALKSRIIGLPESEAETLLLNDPNISYVDIEIRPFFVTKIPSLMRNIEFKIQ